MTSVRFKLLVALALAIALPASAQTLYKLIDKNGKVTYAEKPPKDFDGKVIRMDIDPNANTAILPKPGSGEGGGAAAATPEAQQLRKGITESKRTEQRVERARQNVDAAKRALQSLIDNPSEFDVTRVGIVGGGSRPVFSEAYQERIARAEANVKAAEEELERVEREAR